MEKKFHDLQAEHEQEKIELQKAQTASIQQLMDDTSERLQKMEEDYRKQSKAMGETDTVKQSYNIDKLGLYSLIWGRKRQKSSFVTCLSSIL